MSQPSLPASTEDPVDLVPVLQFPDDVTPSPAPLPPVVPPERKSVEEMNAELRELLQQREQKGGSTDDD